LCWLRPNRFASEESTVFFLKLLREIGPRPREPYRAVSGLCPLEQGGGGIGPLGTSVVGCRVQFQSLVRAGSNSAARNQPTGSRQAFAPIEQPLQVFATVPFPLA